MTDTRALDKAVAAGVIDAGQADRIAAIATEFERAPPRPQLRSPSAAPEDRVVEGDLVRDPENLRFVRGFADIFVTIGIVLVVGPAIYFSDRQFDSTAGIAATVALVAWLLAEYFTRIRRMALPSIVLLSIFAAAAATFFVDLITFADTETLRRVPGLEALPLPPGWDDSARSVAIRSVPAALLTAIAVMLYYLRFRVPIAVAAGVAALVALALAAVGVLFPAVAEANLQWLLFASGIVVFLIAMRFDMADPERVTRRTDIAFWLHVLAAPLIVRPALSGVATTPSADITTQQAAYILLVFAAIGLVSVVIDRRSFLVAGLAYAGYALRSLLGGSGVVDSEVPWTLLILGGLILLLSAGWNVLRRLLLTFAPPPLARRLPPIRA